MVWEAEPTCAMVCPQRPAFAQTQNSTTSVQIIQSAFPLGPRSCIGMRPIEPPTCTRNLIPGKDWTSVRLSTRKDGFDMLSSIQAAGYTAQLLKKEADLYLGSAFQCAWLCERAATSRRTSHTSICMEIRVVSMYFLCRCRALWTDKKQIDNHDCLGRNRET